MGSQVCKVSFDKCNILFARRFATFSFHGISQISLLSVMERPKRFFPNTLPDHAIGADVTVDRKVTQDRLNTTLQKILKNQGQSARDCRDGLYVSLPGVAYAFYYLSTLPTCQTKDEYLQQAYSYIQTSLKYVGSSSGPRDNGQVIGFLLGNAGMYAVAALIFSANGMKDKSNEMVQAYAAAAKTALKPDNADEILVGRAGYLCGLLHLRKNLGIEVIDRELLSSVYMTLLESGIAYMKKRQSLPTPLMYAYYDTEYLGAAHGLAGILQMLLSFPEFLSTDPKKDKTIREAVDFMLSLQQTNGNFPCAMDEVHRRRREEDELIHWCHGAPGVVYLMAKAYLHWQDPKYLKSCLDCGEIVWQKGLLRKGPGICHGVAGNGYVFLLLYRLTHDKKHLHRAIKFSDFMYTEEFRKGARVPDNPNSLYEGLAGTACFLGDLMTPDNAEFPFFDVFN